jgi:lysophospholipid acyltransferase (LPLAT)-like uncharacterized protein
VPDPSDKVYQFADLSQYTFWQRVGIRVLDLACYLLMLVVGATIRYEVEGRENYDSVIASGKLPVWSFWHDRIFLSALYFSHQGVVIMTSQSRDGEYLARFLQRLGFGAVRGSSSRGGARALVQMKRAMLRGHAIGFAVDGPRGPRYVAGPGPVYLAKLTGNPVLPVLMQPKGFWTIRTWDKLQVPKPFTKALLLIAEPFLVEPDSDDAEVERKVTQMQRSLDDLVERGRRWRLGDP